MKTFAFFNPDVIQGAFSDIDRCFESLINAAVRGEDSVVVPSGKHFGHSPAVNIRETDNTYDLEMELPGFDENKIEINFDGSNLTISSKSDETEKKEEKKPDDEENHETWLLKERRIKSFCRSFKLPENANPEAVNAVFKNGILSLQIQKRPEAQKRSIKINAA